jgi:predicted lactoylglutathione lyase
MARKIYVNLSVKDLPRSMAFFSALGFSFQPEFTNEVAAGLIVEPDQIYVMLLTESFFQTFTKKTICDARKSAELLLCLSCSSRQEVDELVAKAVAAGGSVPREPNEHDFMYGHAFEDLDGHIWELIHMPGMPPQG